MHLQLGATRFRRWLCLLSILALLGVVLALLGGCAVKYDKATGYTGAIACVDVTGPGFSWKCNEGSKPVLPDSQTVPTP